MPRPSRAGGTQQVEGGCPQPGRTPQRAIPETHDLRPGRKPRAFCAHSGVKPDTENLKTEQSRDKKLNPQKKKLNPLKIQPTVKATGLNSFGLFNDSSRSSDFFKFSDAKVSCFIPEQEFAF